MTILIKGDEFYKKRDTLKKVNTDSKNWKVYYVDEASTLDYIFLYNSKESKIKLKKSKYLIGPEWEKDDTKKIYGKTVGFSDHYPIQSAIVIPKTP